MNQANLSTVDTTAAVAHVRRQTATRPAVALILGSGLGGLADQIEQPVGIPFTDIPDFATSTAAGHRGQLVFGRVGGVSVVAMAGRFHRYEGWTHHQVTFPVRVLAALGAEVLVVSNAAGGLRHHYQVGELMLIRDHINCIPFGNVAQPTKFRGENPYSSRLAELATKTARTQEITLHQGTYMATLGPTYETRAEYRMMRRMGADCVGMSTVPEVLVAQECGMETLAISMITNIAKPDSPRTSRIETTHEEVLDAGTIGGPRMLALIRNMRW